MIEFYSPDGTLAQNLVFTNLERGQESDVLSIEVWNGRGFPGGTARQEVRVILETEDPVVENLWRAAGLPPQDQRWARYRIVGVQNASVPSWTVPTTDWRDLGAGRAIEIPTLPTDVGVQIELKMAVPLSAVTKTWGWHLVPIYGELSRPVPPGPQEPGAAGVLWHNGDRATSYVITGCALSVAGDVATVAAGQWLYRGEMRGKVETAHQLDQSASDGALQPGESYVATLSLGDLGVTVTKSARAAAPSPPPVPAGEALLHRVTVAYEAGGVSILDPADISDLVAYGRYFAELAGGWDVRVYCGEAVAGYSVRFADVARNYPVPAALQNQPGGFSLWSLSDGTLTYSVQPPSDASLELWWLTTDGVGITTLEDRRQPLRTPTVLELEADVPAAPGLVAARWWDGPPIDLEASVFRLSDAGAGTAGQTQLDLLVDGVSIFDTASQDLRPAFAFNASELRADPIHQRPLIPSGARIELQVAELPTGGAAPARAAVSLVGARR